jgi:DNA-binding MurR/RpiR family transcriptional regulator
VSKAIGEYLSGHGDVFLGINGVYDHLGRAEQRVANFVKNYPEEVVRLPIDVLATKVGVSSSTIIRLCRRIGISGYADLKLGLAQDLARNVRYTYDSLELGNSPEALFEAVRHRMIGSIEDSLRVLSTSDVIKAAALLKNAGSILVIGTGGTAAVADLCNYNLIKMGMNSQGSNDFVAIPLILNRMGPSDVLFAISHSGSTRTVDEAVRIAKSQGCSVIGLTNYPESIIAKKSDVVMTTAVVESPAGSEGGAISVAQIGVLDALWSWLSVGGQDGEEREEAE